MVLAIPELCTIPHKGLANLPAWIVAIKKKKTLWPKERYAEYFV